MTAPDTATPVEIVCQDGVTLHGHRWTACTAKPDGIVVINPATGVLARYYHRYAHFLAQAGFDVLTYDYRGIGLSRPPSLRGCGYHWRDWGELDFDAAVRFADRSRREGQVLVVGHSFGGVIPALAEHAALVGRMLTVGAQYAYWRDYAPAQRTRLFLKWHVIMPAVTLLCGYFPGRRFGWLEDLPAGVANEWSFRRARMELSHPPACRARTLERLASFRAPILAVAVTDDELGTLPAIRRTLAYYRGASVVEAILAPRDFGRAAIGHFGLFHASFADSFWIDTLTWLKHGIVPWPLGSSILN